MAALGESVEKHLWRSICGEAGEEPPQACEQEAEHSLGLTQLCCGEQSRRVTLWVWFSLLS